MPKYQKLIIYKNNLMNINKKVKLQLKNQNIN